jgi:hypothetical protein
MARPANLGKKTTRRTVEVLGANVLSSDQRAQPNEGHVRGQFPINQKRHGQQPQTDQPATRPRKERQIKTIKRSQNPKREGRGRGDQAKRCQAGIPHERMIKYKDDLG